MKRTSKIERQCRVCETNFYVTNSRILRGEGKFCSHKCYWTTLIGKKEPEEQKAKRADRMKKRWLDGTFKGMTGKTSPMKGKKFSKEVREKMSMSAKGKKVSDSHRRAISEAHKKRVRAGLNNLWKGGKTKEGASIRSGTQYKLWRKSVFERDNYTCQECGDKGVELNADHIKPFAYFPELRFELSNGRTLCKPCHKLTDTYMGRASKKYLIKNTGRPLASHILPGTFRAKTD